MYTHFLGAKKVSTSSVHKQLWVLLLIGINKGNLNPIHIGQDSKVNVQVWQNNMCDKTT